MSLVREKSYSMLKEPYLLKQGTFKRLFTAAGLIFLLLIVGTLGYMVIEKWDVLNSFYMTVITIATVGFREVGDMGTRGKLFTSALIFLGIGIGGYAIGTIAAFLIEGQMLDLVKGRKMAKAITNLRNHIIVCGYGKIGKEVCHRLAEAGKDFIVIDKAMENIEDALAYGYLAAVGEATDDDILIKSGIQNAEGLVSAISDDSANVYLVLTARALNEKLRIIARGVGETSQKKMLRAGADRVVSPYEIGARRMAALSIKPDMVDFIEALTPSHSYGLLIEKLTLNKDSNLVGKRLDESFIKRDTNGAMVLGIEKVGHKMLLNPHGSTILQENDMLLSIGTEEQLNALKKLVTK